ncbi:hypothetical protein IV203_036077 [Nitzschia inconspicua]|uniref:Transmembrane protein n=1 Tax=Nitzschia inconspicua TaxID=303405 RepID=A0A9K3LFB9_9STRA|nr:hypothetical protein IV203_036077 [Nitzschia inconspicua]
MATEQSCQLRPSLVSFTSCRALLVTVVTLACLSSLNAFPCILGPHRSLGKTRKVSILASPWQLHGTKPTKEPNDLFSREDESNIESRPGTISNTDEVGKVKAEDLPWFDFSQVQQTNQTSTLPLFASSFIFVTSIVGTLYMYYVGIFGMPHDPPDAL